MRYNYPFFVNDETGLELEKQTFADVIDEAVYLYGVELVWLPQTLNQPDDVFGEFLGKMIQEGTSIRLFTQQVETDFYPEDQGMFDKFGFVPNVGEVTFVATKQYFDEHGINPKHQDLIYYKKVNKVFEVTHVNELDGFKWKITCVLYNYDHTKLSPDVTEEDILTLENLDDNVKEDYNDKIDQAEQDESIIDDTETEGLFD